MKDSKQLLLQVQLYLLYSNKLVITLGLQMKKIRYPFDLQGQISVFFKEHINPVFVNTCSNNSASISVDDFVVKSFNYDSESRSLSVSLQKAINAINNEYDTENIATGTELKNNIINLDLIYCLYNAVIISSHISYPLDASSFIKSVSISKSLTLNLN